MVKQTLESFLDFSSQLTRLLEARDEVIGLVFVGSSAATHRVDEWSDHDFFVVTKPGVAESFRKDLSWLPDSGQIVLSPRETAHGLKVLYANGHVLEFAVFEDSELELASANDYAVALDRADITSRMAAIAARSGPTTFDFDAEFELLLIQYLIAVGRARRGELLTAGDTIRGACVNHFVGLIRYSIKPLPGSQSATDNLNRLRRFELQYPEIGERLAEILSMPAEVSAKAQLGYLLQVLAECLSSDQLEQAKSLSKLLDWD